MVTCVCDYRWQTIECMVDDTWKTSRDTNMTKVDDRAASQHGTAVLTLLGHAKPIHSANEHTKLLNDPFTISSSVLWAHVFLGRRQTKWLSKFISVETKWTLPSRPFPNIEKNQLNIQPAACSGITLRAVIENLKFLILSTALFNLIYLLFYSGHFHS